MPTTVPHATGGAHRNDSSENAPIPSTLPVMSSRYASSGSNSTNVRATPSPIIAITDATARKMTGSVIQVGRPLGVKVPK